MINNSLTQSWEKNGSQDFRETETIWVALGSLIVLEFHNRETLKSVK